MVKKRGGNFSKSKKVSRNKQIFGKESPITKSLAWVAGVINVVFFPGLGSLIALRFKPGIYQLVLYLIGLVGFMIGYLGLYVLDSPTLVIGIILGLLLILISWIWAIITSVDFIRSS
jgi:hypothetical protein